MSSVPPLEPPSPWSAIGLDARIEAQRRSLIEASAGTGKTWTISVLYLRLLLETGHRVAEIAVTTFTDAAAHELRQRIRSRLSWAVQEIAQRVATADNTADADDAADADANSDGDGELRAWLQRRWQAVDAQRDAIVLRLALFELDRAPIGTMHALCLKLLTDAPLAAGGTLRVATLIGDDELYQEIGDDLLRELAFRRADDDGERAAITRLLQSSPADRRALLRALFAPGVLLRAAADDGRDLMHDASAWAVRLRELATRDIYLRKNSAVANQLQVLADFLDAGDAHAACADNGALDDPSGLDKRVRADLIASVLADETYQYAALLCRKLEARERRGRSRLLLSLAVELRAWRAERLREREQQTFDGLIAQVHERMLQPRDTPGHLADSAFAQWPIALIDEFQDTDASQYAIFDAIYRDAAAAPRGQLILIGDPKQAIYRFRGGDIATYLRAAEDCSQQLRLDRNFRSSSALVEALNEFYDACLDGFGAAHARIRFQRMRAAKHADAKPLRVHGELLTRPLILHQRNDVDEGTALAACANLIVDYLRDGAATIGSRALHAGDIAVLLPANHQVARMRGLLARCGVPCVGAGRASVFDGDTAAQLRVVLHACLHPRDLPALRAALATPWFGLDYAALRALDDDQLLWRAHGEQFARLALAWDSLGVLAVVDTLLVLAAPRVLDADDGERALTDLRHLGEILQAQSALRPGRAQLLAWFARQCDSVASSEEGATKERLLRIESDQARVQLLTLHSAKGLEFPVVLLPLMWTQRGRVETFPVTTGADGRRVLDLGSEQHADAQAGAARESMQERLRVLYVALTRAAHVCHLFLGPDSTDAHQDSISALDWLKREIDWTRLRQAAHVAIRDDLALLPQRLPRAPAPTVARVARQPRRGHRALTLHSFSTLTHGLKHSAALDPDAATSDEADIEAALATSAPENYGAQDALRALNDFRGTAFGTAVHGMFEHREPGLALSAQTALIREQLQLAGIALRELELRSLSEQLARRLDACLDSEIAPGLRLASLAPRAQRAEMDFQFVLDGLDLGALRELCARHALPDLVPRQIGWRELSGFMTGKIDLLFEHDGRVHVADYKSNLLGDTLDAYRGDALEAAMLRAHYPFQGFVYALALDRYLQQRLRDYRRERDLGECFFLFVRAIGLAPGAGVWRHRFAPALIAQAQQLFMTAALTP